MNCNCHAVAVFGHTQCRLATPPAPSSTPSHDWPCDYCRQVIAARDKGRLAEPPIVIS